MIPIQTVHLVGFFFLHPHIFPENDPWGPATLPGCQVQVLWRSDATNPVEDHLVHVPCNEVIQVGMVGDPKMEALEVLYMTNITIFQAIFCGDIPWNLGLTWALYMGVTSNLATWNGHSASPISFAWTPKWVEKITISIQFWTQVWSQSQPSISTMAIQWVANSPERARQGWPSMWSFAWTIWPCLKTLMAWRSAWTTTRKMRIQPINIWIYCKTFKTIQNNWIEPAKEEINRNHQKIRLYKHIKLGIWRIRTVNQSMKIGILLVISYTIYILAIQPGCWKVFDVQFL